MEEKELSLEESMLSWLETAKKPELKPSSFMRLYNTVTKQIIPRIGSCSISDLTVPYIEESSCVSSSIRLNLIRTMN